MRSSSRPRLPYPALVLVTDSRRLDGEGARLCAIVREAVAGGVNVVQLREKHLSYDDLVALGGKVREAIGDQALFFVNGDVEAGIALDADGMHLPQDGASIGEVRARAGAAMFISQAVHSAEGARRAEQDGADLIQLGTVFETGSKPDARGIGTEGVRAVTARATIPVIAIGGITPSNAADVIGAGAAGVAVIGAILDAGDARDAAGRIAAAIVASATPI